MQDVAMETLLTVILWILAVLTVQFLLVIATGAWLQIRRNRLNQLRIRCAVNWEEGLVDFVYYDAPWDPIHHARERRLFIPFLLKAASALAGREGEKVRNLYSYLALWRGLDDRLQSRKAAVRSQAALEVGSFFLDRHYPRLLALLEDPVPHVAHAAARSLAGTGRLEFAAPVLDWVLAEEAFQQERLLWILEGFGQELLPWMEARLAANAEPIPGEDLIYALLAASLRHVQDLSRLMAMLTRPNLEVQAAALKALGAIGDPQALPDVFPFGRDPSWILRAQAAKTIGSLAGPGAIPLLLELLGDPVFDVRRNAAQAMASLGPAGREALAWVAQDPGADPFARDLALERLQWLPRRDAA
jgi:HEAT repeat protein